MDNEPIKPITDSKIENPDEEEEDRKLPAWMVANQSLETDRNENGAKSLTPDPEDARSESSSALEASTSKAPSSNRRESCKYGAGCYRRNPAHKQEYSHPGDDDYITTLQKEEEDEEISGGESDDRPECQYGTSCYRQNPQHKRDFKHTEPPRAPTPEKRTPQRPAKRRRTSDADYESEGDREYDLEDSWIDDSAEEEGNDEEDEDYVPDNNEVDPELLKEEEWKATADDAPEVLELLKEARDYLRNKKLHK